MAESSKYIHWQQDELGRQWPFCVTVRPPAQLWMLSGRCLGLLSDTPHSSLVRYAAKKSCRQQYTSMESLNSISV